MRRFSYSALNDDGRTVKGELVAESDLAALDRIAKGGLTPVELREGGTALPWWQRELSLTGETGIKPRIMAEFFNMLSVMLQAKYPLAKSLGYCRAQARDPRLRQVLDLVQSEVENGARFADALGQADGAVPSRYLSIIETGEASNQLEIVVSHLADGLVEELNLRREIRQALVYPAILIMLSGVVLALLVFYLAPTLIPVFETSSAEPPKILSLMNDIRVVVLSNWPVLLGVFAVALLALLMARNTIGAGIVRFATFVPGIGAFIRKRNSLAFCQTLLLFLSSGDRVQTAMTEASTTFSDPRWQRYIEGAGERLLNGDSLTIALSDPTLLDPLALAMIDAGEQGDQLAETLETAVSSLRDQTRSTVNQSVRLIAPVLTLLIGLGLGGVILATITAILDLNTIAF